MTTFAPALRRRATAALAVLVAAVVLPVGIATANPLLHTRIAPPKLHGYITASGAVSIRNCASCPRLTKVPEGRYTLVLHDSTKKHGLRIEGPDVDEGTTDAQTTPARGLEIGVIDLSAGDE